MRDLATQVVMPQMGYDMEEGTVVRWIKGEGDDVKRGEPVAEIETDKAVVEMEATANGVLRKIITAEGTTVPVGQLIAIIGTADEDIGEVGVADAPPPKEELSPPPAVEAPVVEQDAKTPAQRIKASPVARRLAKEKGIDMAQVTGSGPGGRIVRDDVLSHETTGQAAAPAPAVAETAIAEAPVPVASAPAISSAALDIEPGRLDLSRMRQGIARAVSLSKNGTPHFYVTLSIDMTDAMVTRAQINDATDQVRVSVNDMVMKAVVMALGKYPSLNASFKDDHLETHPYVNLGMAISLEQGLMVPAIVNAQDKSLVEMAVASKDLAERANGGRIRQDEYNGTFSTSNLGMFGVDEFSAIILPPQAAVLAISAIKKQPVVDENDQVVVRQMMNVTISIDHRVSDGVEGAQFLQEVKRVLEHPLALLM